MMQLASLKFVGGLLATRACRFKQWRTCCGTPSLGHWFHNHGGHVDGFSGPVAVSKTTTKWFIFAIVSGLNGVEPFSSEKGCGLGVVNILLKIADGHLLKSWISTAGGSIIPVNKTQRYKHGVRAHMSHGQNSAWVIHQKKREITQLSSKKLTWKMKMSSFNR